MPKGIAKHMVIKNPSKTLKVLIAICLIKAPDFINSPNDTITSFGVGRI